MHINAAKALVQGDAIIDLSNTNFREELKRTRKVPVFEADIDLHADYSVDKMDLNQNSECPIVIVGPTGQLHGHNIQIGTFYVSEDRIPVITEEVTTTVFNNTVESERLHLEY